MATLESVAAHASTHRAGSRACASLFVGGGVLMALGGKLHPIGSGTTVESHLESMFASPTWPLAHVVLLLGGILSFLALVVAWRGEVFGPRLQRWLGAAAIGWGIGAVELVPHLLASHDAHALAEHDATPVLDLHVALSVVAGPAVGLTGALLAVVIARAARSRVAWVLAVFGVVGGLLSGAAAPLVVATGDPAFTALFPFQAGLAVWLVGTGLRLWRR